MLRRLIPSLILILTLSACNLNSPVATVEPTAEPVSSPEPLNPGTDPLLPQITNTPRISESGCPIPDGWVEYIVRPGDTLSAIADQADITIAELTNGNCLENADQINVDQVLYVPPGIVPGVSVPNTSAGLEIYLIALGESGGSGPRVGCDDSAILQRTGVQPSGDIATQLFASLQAMLAFDNGIRAGDQRGVYNAFAGQSLTLRDVSVSGGTALVRFDGRLQLTGVCEDARLQGQMLLNVFKYPEVQNAMITIGGQNMRQLFDASGLAGPDAVYSRSDVPA